jgi:hypothetical protein
VYYYEEFLSSEGLELDYASDGSEYRLFNRRTNGIDILHFDSNHSSRYRLRIVDRVDLPGRTQLFRKQKYPSTVLDCLSTRDDGSCLYVVDLEKPHQPLEHVFNDRIIKSYDSYDEYGKVYCMSSHDTLFQYDCRDQNLNQIVRITNQFESKFNLIYNTFRDGRMISLVTMQNILVFDIRNPGECVLKFKHFCDVPPNRHTFAKCRDDGVHQSLLESLLASANNPELLGKVESQIDGFISDSADFKDKTLKNSLCLYSCRHNSFPVFLPSYEPYDKQDVENKLNYDIIKEINQTLDPNSLFSQLTRGEIHPQRLFSSNVIDGDQRTNGVSLLYHNEKIYYIHLDNSDNLALQIIQKRGDKEKGYCFRRLDKPKGEVYDEHIHKALVSFQENPRMTVRKTSVEIVTDLPIQRWISAKDLSEKIEVAGDQQFNDVSSADLDSLPEAENPKLLLDIRSQVKRLAQGKTKFKQLGSVQSEMLAKYKSLSDKIMAENEEDPVVLESKIMEMSPVEQSRLMINSAAKHDKEDLLEARELSNDRFFITKQTFNFLKGNY